MRELITILLLGFFIGLALGYKLGFKDSDGYTQQYYQAEVARLKNWNDSLIKSQLFILEEKRKK